MANWTEKRLKCLKLLHKEGFSANVIAGKLALSAWPSREPVYSRRFPRG